MHYFILFFYTIFIIYVALWCTSHLYSYVYIIISKITYMLIFFWSSKIICIPYRKLKKNMSTTSIRLITIIINKIK